MIETTIPFSDIRKPLSPRDRSRIWRGVRAITMMQCQIRARFGVSMLGFLLLFLALQVEVHGILGHILGLLGDHDLFLLCGVTAA